VARFKDVEWQLDDSASYERAQLAVLMDIRDELKRLNRLLDCRNFLAVPARLARIAKAVERIK
jgi:hypothetical protein